MNQQDKQYWLRMTERYFEAETSDEEEAALRRFAATTRDADFDELRAVMGFAAVASVYAESDRRHSRVAAYLRVAASVLLIVCVSLLALLLSGGEGSEQCVAYVNGRQVTDESQVFALMSETLESMTQSIGEADPVESQLEMMFN